MKIIFSSRAQLDLDLIWLRIFEQNSQVADKIVEAIKLDCYRLATHPGLGEKCNHLSPNMRRISSGAYLVYYKPHDEVLEIIRVLHGARDVESLF